MMQAQRMHSAMQADQAKAKGGQSQPPPAQQALAALANSDGKPPHQATLPKPRASTAPGGRQSEQDSQLQDGYGGGDDGARGYGGEGGGRGAAATAAAAVVAAVDPGGSEAAGTSPSDGPATGASSSRAEPEGQASSYAGAGHAGHGASTAVARQQAAGQPHEQAPLSVEAALRERIKTLEVESSAPKARPPPRPRPRVGWVGGALSGTQA